MAKVLIYTPTYGDGPRPETMESVRTQQFAGTFKHIVSRHNPFGENDLRNVTAQYARGRDLALGSDYDALLCVEHDMRLPADALQRLWDTGAPVAYGAYRFRHGGGVLNVLGKYATPSRNLGDSLGYSPRRLAAARRRGVVECSGLGLGCTLIRREVLERLPFRDPPGTEGCTDMGLAMDCLQRGIRQAADLNVRCGHWDGAHWLEPFAEEEPVSVRVLKSVTARIGYRSRRLVRNGEYALPVGDAMELARAGYVEVMA